MRRAWMLADTCGMYFLTFDAWVAKPEAEKALSAERASHGTSEHSKDYALRNYKLVEICLHESEPSG